jgi:hypothetical protein
MALQNIINSPTVSSGWTSYNLVIGAVTTAPTLGTVIQNTAYYKQDGKQLTIMYSFSQSTAGSAGSGIYLYPLPSGFIINTTIAVPLAVSSGVAIGTSLGSSTAYFGASQKGIGTVFSYDSTRLQITIYNDNGTNPLVPMLAVGSFVGGGFYNLGNVNVGYSFTATIPIN